jgi:hypothetical protein
VTVPDASELRGVRISVDSWRSFMGNWYVKVEIGAGKPMTLTFTEARELIAALERELARRERETEPEEVF